jgi:hypothetical protein
VKSMCVIAVLGCAARAACRACPKHLEPPGTPKSKLQQVAGGEPVVGSALSTLSKQAWIQHRQSLGRPEFGSARMLVGSLRGSEIAAAVASAFARLAVAKTASMWQAVTLAHCVQTGARTC